MLSSQIICLIRIKSFLNVLDQYGAKPAAPSLFVYVWLFNTFVCLPSISNHLPCPVLAESTLVCVVFSFIFCISCQAFFKIKVFRMSAFACLVNIFYLHFHCKHAQTALDYHLFLRQNGVPVRCVSLSLLSSGPNLKKNKFTSFHFVHRLIH